MEYKLFMFEDITTIPQFREIIKVQDKKGKTNFRKITGLEDDKQHGRFIVTSSIVDNLFVEQMKEAIERGKQKEEISNE